MRLHVDTITFSKILREPYFKANSYAVVDQLHTGRYYIKQFLANWFNMPMSEFEAHLFIHEEDEAINHLFRVTAGIDSMVLGETQILGQVKKSFLQGQEMGKRILF